MEDLVMQHIHDLLSNYPGLPQAISMDKAIQFIRITASLKRGIIHSQKSNYDHNEAPEVLPDGVHQFLGGALDLNDEFVRGCWEAFKGTIWMYDPDHHSSAADAFSTSMAKAITLVHESPVRKGQPTPSQNNKSWPKGCSFHARKRRNAANFQLRPQLQRTTVATPPDEDITKSLQDDGEALDEGIEEAAVPVNPLSEGTTCPQKPDTGIRRVTARFGRRRGDEDNNIGESKDAEEVRRTKRGVYVGEGVQYRVIQMDPHATLQQTEDIDDNDDTSETSLPRKRTKISRAASPHQVIQTFVQSSQGSKQVSALQNEIGHATADPLSSVMRQMSGHSSQRLQQALHSYKVLREKIEATVSNGNVDFSLFVTLNNELANVYSDLKDNGYKGSVETNGLRDVFSNTPRSVNSFDGLVFVDDLRKVLKIADNKRPDNRTSAALSTLAPTADSIPPDRMINTNSMAVEGPEIDQTTLHASPVSNIAPILSGTIPQHPSFSVSTSPSRITRSRSRAQHESSAAPPSDTEQPPSEAASCEGCLKDGVVCSPPPPKKPGQRGRAKLSCERCSTKQRKCSNSAKPSVPRKVEGEPAIQYDVEASAAPAILTVDAKPAIAGETLVFTPPSPQSQGASIPDGPDEVETDVLGDATATPAAAVKQDFDALCEHVAKLDQQAVQSQNNIQSYTASLSQQMRTLEGHQIELLRALYPFFYSLSSNIGLVSSSEGLLKVVKKLLDETAIAKGTINHDGRRDLMLGSSIGKKRTTEVLDDLEDSKKRRRSQERSVR
ncbi:hypothetical protein BDZ97DRAFT_1924094 [Flammula alnicola]|nr:hypothetical protein BDZ97DRAFT_1924094 [Flammula alnicola]